RRAVDGRRGLHRTGRSRGDAVSPRISTAPAGLRWRAQARLVTALAVHPAEDAPRHLAHQMLQIGGASLVIFAHHPVEDGFETAGAPAVLAGDLHFAEHVERRAERAKIFGRQPRLL